MILYEVFEMVAFNYIYVYAMNFNIRLDIYRISGNMAEFACQIIRHYQIVQALQKPYSLEELLPPQGLEILLLHM